MTKLNPPFDARRLSLYTGSPGHFSAFGIEKKRVSAFARVIRDSAYLVVCLVPVGRLPRPDS